jgi:hypothetical protein
MREICQKRKVQELQQESKERDCATELAGIRHGSSGGNTA